MKITLSDTSKCTPVLQKGILFLACTGEDSGLNFLSSSDNGASSGNKDTSSEKSSHGPAFCKLGDADRMEG